MIYLKNWIIIIFINILNKAGRGFYLKKKIFSSKRILENNFPKECFFNFIQVGANDGVSFDFLYDFVTQRKSVGLVIEPVKEYFDELVENYKDYPKIVKVNKALHASEKNIEIHKISPNSVNNYPDWVKGIASLNAEHHKKINVDSNDITKEEVIADNLMNIINQNLPHIKFDYFQTDTEGFDYEVLKMIDFTVVKPCAIKYESVHLNDYEKSTLRELLKKQGYFVFDEFGDSIAFNIKKIKLI